MGRWLESLFGRNDLGVDDTLVFSLVGVSRFMIDIIKVDAAQKCAERIFPSIHDHFQSPLRRPWYLASDARKCKCNMVFDLL